MVTRKPKRENYAPTPFIKDVRKALIDKGMSQRQLAEAVGTSPRHLSFIMTGDRNPGKHKEAILTALGLGHMDTAS